MKIKIETNEIFRSLIVSYNSNKVFPGEPVRVQARPNDRIELFIDEVKHTGGALVEGKRIYLKKQDKALVFVIDDEPFVMVENFYDTEGVSLDGQAWSYSADAFLQASDTGIAALPQSAELADPFAPQLVQLPLIVASAGGTVVPALGGASISAAIREDVLSRTLKDHIVRGVITSGDVIAGNDLQVSVYGIATDGTATLLKTGAVDSAGAYNINIGSYAGAVRVVVQSTGGNPDY